ncbi:MAG: HlyD family efflux transporter periplasmic adaptor subunit [Thiolinea sp.]
MNKNMPYRGLPGLLVLGGLLAFIVAPNSLAQEVEQGAETAPLAEFDRPTRPDLSGSLGVPAGIISLQDSLVSAEIAANIEQIGFDVGDRVERGAALARLDCREFTIREEQAQADLNSLKARMLGIQARVEAAKNDMASNESSVGLLHSQAKAAEANVSAAQADAGRVRAQSQAEQAKCQLAGLEVKRARELRQRQVIAQQELDQAESAFRAAQAACNAVQPEIGSANAKAQAMKAGAEAALVAVKVQQAKARMAYSNVKVAEAEIPALNAQIAAAAARLKTEQLQVSRCVLRAPFQGEIAERRVQIGQRIGIGEQAFRLVSINDKEVSAALSDAELEQVRKAKKLHFQTPDDRYAVDFRAAVGLVSGEARTREGRFRFRADNELPIGKTGRIVWEGAGDE